MTQETQETQTGTLEELDVKPGDAVEWIGYEHVGHHTLDFIADDGAYVFDTEQGQFAHGPDDPSFSLISRAATPPLTIEAGKYYKTRDGRKVGPMCGMISKWNNDGTCRRACDTRCDELIAEWIDTPADTPPTWGDMTDAEKGALLLAELDGECLEQKGRVIVNGESLFRWAPKQEGCWLDKFAYRIKPEPLVENVTLMVYDNGEGQPHIAEYMSDPNYRMVYTRTNGEPDLDSIKMERIND